MYKWKPEFPHKALFKNAAAIVGVSQGIKKEYAERTGSEVKLIPPLIPFRNYDDGREKLRTKYGYGLKDTIILSLGSIKKNKGNDILLTTFIKLGKKFIEEHKLRLLFVGDGNMRKDLEEMAKRENFSMYVKFLGIIPREEVPAIFKIADIYIISSFFEGTPISMLEAMFNRMPIIGSDVIGINNIIEHERNGLLFEANNCAELKDKIACLVNNKNIAEKIANEAKKDYDSNYNFESVVKQYRELYEKSGRTQKI
jgi:glycosyltransferase involved in cell wall biosynthesis